VFAVTCVRDDSAFNLAPGVRLRRPERGGAMADDQRRTVAARESPGRFITVRDGTDVARRRDVVAHAVAPDGSVPVRTEPSFM